MYFLSKNGDSFQPAMLVYQAGYVFSEHVSEIFRKKFPASIETQVKRANIERERERDTFGKTPGQEIWKKKNKRQHLGEPQELDYLII